MVPVTASLAWAIACGLGLGLGLWSIVSRSPRLAPQRLAGRIAPHLVDVSEEARRMQARPVADPLPVVGVLALPALALFQTLFGSVLGVSSGTAQRLRQAGDPRSVESYRLAQMLWTLAGAGAGVAAAVLLGATRGPGAGSIALPIVGAGAGLLARDRVLRRAAAIRMRRIESELPTDLEFLALSLAAGEGVHDAVRRIARVGSGELALELRRVVAEVGVGVPLGRALSRLADELAIPALTRCITHMVAALDRGAPLAELLRVQAADTREEARRALLEAAGKKEVAMLVPLVFGILPVTIAFAVFPGLLVLQTRL